jgi:GT2 family glycosyltransferase
MISLVVCSVNETLFNAFEASVKDTIGTEYEIIRIDNRGSEMGIAAAYNKGAAAAKYAHLVFVHEDVIFHTQGWGPVLLQHFSNLPHAGVLGIMGANYISYVPRGWYINDRSRMFAHLLQGLPDNQTRTVNINSKIPAPVFSVDGCFIAVKKETWATNRFDEELEGFHGYDLSFSLRVAIKFQNYFINGITLTHLSQGSFDEGWIKANLAVREKLFSHLPYLAGRNRIVRSLERRLLFQSLCEIDALAIPMQKKKELAIRYYQWSARWMGRLSATWVWFRYKVRGSEKSKM